MKDDDITAADLQAAARAKLGPNADPRVVSVFVQGELSLEHDVAEWEATSGHMRSHRVRIGLTADLLGMVRGHPHVEDEVTRIVSLVMTTRPNESVSELSFHFDRNAAPPVVESPYRGAAPVPPAPDTEPSLAREPNWPALASDYLAACGHAEIAAIASRARIQIKSAHSDGEERHHVAVTLAAADASTPRIRLAFLGTCLRDLLEGPRGTLVRVEMR
ncbi:MAG: hypothetical protein JWM74_351 [Myxococcaceae bacterium]|nr:hypothetical protein [Myxococcaceae bacterium]